MLEAFPILIDQFWPIFRQRKTKPLSGEFQVPQIFLLYPTLRLSQCEVLFMQRGMLCTNLQRINWQNLWYFDIHRHFVLQYLTFLSWINQIQHLHLWDTFIWDTHFLCLFLFKFNYPTSRCDQYLSIRFHALLSKLAGKFSMWSHELTEQPSYPHCILI